VEGTIVLDDGTMLCTVPAGSPSTRVDVEVITAAGVVVAEDAFQYLAGPVVVLHISWTDNDAVAHTGLIAVELFEDNAPTHVDNFLQLAEGSFYDQVPFHRVIDGFMIQGGDFENGNGTGGHAAQYYGFGDPGDESTWTVPDEADNGLTHVPGVLSMAKTGLPNSGGSQFFFVDRDSFPSHLDGVHTVFGRAAVGVMDSLEVTGLDVVDELSQVATDFNDRPLLPVTIESAIRIGGSSSAFLAGPGGGLAGEAHAWDALYTPWNSGALLAALSAAEGAGAGRWSGTRGVFRGEASAGDRLMVWVRSLERGAVPCAPIAIGDRAGWLSLVAGASDGAIEERCY
jgi:cyclophilin family peptidyl-prolyl cis-trans isomerase